jgi:hypothetical protein
MVKDLDLLAEQLFWKKEKWIINRLDFAIGKAKFEFFVEMNKRFIMGYITTREYVRRTGGNVPKNVSKARKVYRNMGHEPFKVTQRKLNQIPNLYW